MKGATHIPAGGDSALIQRLLDFLRRQHPIKTADHVSAITGLPTATIRKWIDRGSFPSGPNFLLLLVCYGPSLLQELYDEAPKWVIQAIDQDRIDTIKTDVERLNDELTMLRNRLSS